VQFNYNNSGANTLQVNGYTVATFTPNGLSGADILQFPAIVIPHGQSYSFTLFGTNTVSTISELR